MRYTIPPENLFVSLGTREGGFSAHKLASDGVSRLADAEMQTALEDNPNRLRAMLAIAQMEERSELLAKVLALIDSKGMKS